MKEYCANVVNRMGEDARDVVIQIVPFAFRISLQVVFVDSKQKDERVIGQFINTVEPAYGDTRIFWQVRRLLFEST